jgi:hypothetical protein
VNSQVTTALRSTLRPGLRAAGFTEFDVAPQGSPRWHERVALLESLR